MTSKFTRSVANAGNSGNDSFDHGTSAILKRLDALEKKNDKKAEELKTIFEDKFTQFREDLLSEFLPRIKTNEKNILANAENIEEVETRVEYLENKLEMYEKAADLIVRGVPMDARVVVANYYYAIAGVLGYESTNIPPADVFRLGRKQPNPKQGPLIIIKFASKLDKSCFFKKYLENMNQMKLSILGFNDDQSRFYISENLTRHNQSIYNEALKLKKSGKIIGVTSSFGSVYVKPKNAQRSVVVKDLKKLSLYSNSE